MATPLHLIMQAYHPPVDKLVYLSQMRRTQKDPVLHHNWCRYHTFGLALVRHLQKQAYRLPIGSVIGVGSVSISEIRAPAGGSKPT